MTTINFSVAVPAGAPIGNVDGEEGYISTYLAKNVSGGYSPQNNILFCIAPDKLAFSSVSSYSVLSGVGDSSFSLTQKNSLEGLFSHYIDGGNTSFAVQEATMIADWTIVNPSLVVSGVPSSILLSAHALATNALAGNFVIDSHLKFVTFESKYGGQDFVNISQVPLPASLGLFMAALALLGAYAMRKKLSRG